MAESIKHERLKPSQVKDCHLWKAAHGKHLSGKTVRGVIKKIGLRDSRDQVCTPTVLDDGKAAINIFDFEYITVKSSNLR